MPTPLVLLSHGSRHPHAQAGLDRLADAVRKQIDAEVAVAHLEFSDDTLAAVVKRLGGRAVVVPLLFSSGYHSRVDVPEEVRAVDGEVVLADAIGASQDVAEVVARLITAQSDRRGAVVWSVGSSMSDARRDIDALVAQVAALVDVPVVHVAATNCSKKLESFPGYTVVPLFVTDGLLLDKARREAAKGSTVLGPLAEELAPVVVQRYRDAVSVSGCSDNSVLNF